MGEGSVYNPKQQSAKLPSPCRSRGTLYIYTSTAGVVCLRFRALGLKPQALNWNMHVLRIDECVCGHKHLRKKTEYARVKMQAKTCH